MNKRKRYKISVYKVGHHAIVISDGENEDITFEITAAGSKISAISGQEQALAKVAIFNSDNRKDLKHTREKWCTLYQLAQTAASILDSNRQYDVVNNNCQHFCNKFLKNNGLPTYTTDTKSLTATVEVTQKIASAIASYYQPAEVTGVLNLDESTSQATS